MKHKRIISIFATLCVMAVAAIFMFNNPMSAEERLLRENTQALAICVICATSPCTCPDGMGEEGGDLGGGARCLLKGDAGTQSTFADVCRNGNCDRIQGLQTPIGGGIIINCP